MAEGKSRPPAETSAEYSPRLWPATKSGVMPCLARVRKAATETARMAGCVLAVSFSSSSVPSQHILKSSKPTAASASSKTPLASGKLSARSRPMPGYCEAWPGNKNASLPIVFFCGETGATTTPRTSAAKAARQRPTGGGAEAPPYQDYFKARQKPLDVDSTLQQRGAKITWRRFRQ